MTDLALFAAGEAARITGVDPDTQLAWRRRGHLPEKTAGHVRYTVRELCRLALVKAIVDAGFPIGLAVSQLSEDFLDSLQSQVMTHGREGYDDMLAVIGFVDGQMHRYVIWTLQDLSIIEKEIGCPFSNFHVIRLAKIAADLVEKGILYNPDLKERQ